MPRSTQKSQPPLAPQHVTSPGYELLTTPGGGFYRFIKNPTGEAEPRHVPLLALNAEDTGIALGGLSVDTVYALRDAGRLHAVRNIRHLTFDIEEIKRFLREGTEGVDD